MNKYLHLYSPRLGHLYIFRQYVPYLVKCGPRRFRRYLVDNFASAHGQNLKTVIDIMDQKSKEIFHSKKTALLKRDEAVVRQVGDGKDILSILSMGLHSLGVHAG